MIWSELCRKQFIYFLFLFFCQQLSLYRLWVPICVQHWGTSRWSMSWPGVFAPPTTVVWRHYHRKNLGILRLKNHAYLHAIIMRGNTRQRRKLFGERGSSLCCPRPNYRWARSPVSAPRWFGVIGYKHSAEDAFRGKEIISLKPRPNSFDDTTTNDPLWLVVWKFINNVCNSNCYRPVWAPGL